MKTNEKLLLNICIQKYAKNFSKKDLCEGIISKYTLSRMYHGYTCKDSTYHKLLEKMNYYYNHHYDLTLLFLQFKDLYNAILLMREEKIINILHKIKKHIYSHNTHILFIEVQDYFNLLSTHFIQNKNIQMCDINLKSLTYMPETIRAVLIHTLCENMLFQAKVENIKLIFTNYSIENDKNPLIDYWRMFLLQSRKNHIDAYTIYKNHKYIFLEENNFQQFFRFTIVHTTCNIHKKQSTCEKQLKQLEILFKRNIKTNRYEMYLYFTYAILYIHKNQYDLAYNYMLKAYASCTNTQSLIPYLLLLSILLNKENNYIISNENIHKINQACIHLWNLYKQNKLKEFLKFTVRTMPKICYENPYYESLIPILYEIVMDFALQTRCYKANIDFDVNVKIYKNLEEFKK